MSSTHIFVDSRFRTSGSHSDFQYQLRETVTVWGARLSVKHIRFTDTFYTVEEWNRRFYFEDPAEGVRFVELPVAAYTGAKLAAALQQLTGRSVSYSDQTNAITMSSSAGAHPLTDEQLAQLGYADPMSVNNVLGFYELSADGATVTYPFVSMNPFADIYLRSHTLRCHRSFGPQGTHDILCKITLKEGVGRVVEAGMADGVYLDLGDASLRSIDFRLTDVKGRPVNLRGDAGLSFQIILD